MREINHRVKNQYAVVLAVIRQTVTRSTSIEDSKNGSANASWRCPIPMILPDSLLAQSG
ncbi:HWE histidine kinase domain-containing protein [Agrobacterium vitis]|uniref:HWE histidine kinase domain-containing protein n=1 Tax=Agrobacterium vitis TaxID=373 RepID=UPI001F33C626|nr:HWE histidine kinase domain-containing protein [Agrobacterium vitis]